MWIATDSANLYPVLIEIETPHKPWFYGDRAEIHSSFIHAQGQLAEWRAWFNEGTNPLAFLDHYEVPDLLRRRQLAPRYVLIYGRRDDYAGSQRRLEKRAQLAREDERLMSFDRLTPAKYGPMLACVAKRQDGYRAVSVPPSWTIENDGDDYLPVQGWDSALDAAEDMAEVRRRYLKAELGQLLADPHRHYQTGDGGVRFRHIRWL
ncbi:DUF4263 domain-containing protein [Catenulispora sp. NL8]|uniref:DUF4263 domain-containing protein n=2 Tax=Catenulispora pinistramenti TaxID=2705254 RepID=A0ABS5KUA7_9ACTN|nr:DUF4263 domain-containing protein [Catenulispora pinistramenti]